jgi:sulfopyruvate decarboxylase TPP-binding subunit
MLDGPSVVAALKECGITHVVWIPDSETGTWEAALHNDPDIKLIRVCREGEAFTLAAGLYLGGKQPLIIIQCTGLFEAGDALRNVLHDLKLPLFMIIGVRSWYAHREGKSVDTCPIFTEPILQAWKVPYVRLEKNATAKDLAAVYRQAKTENRAGAVLIAE